MFDEHQDKIGRYARGSHRNMARVYTFVLATIQQSLWQTPAIMASIDAEGVESRFLWGMKENGYTYAVSEAEGIYDTSMAIWMSFTDDAIPYELTRFYAGLPGLGVVKGGFMAQLCFGVSGCIDTHNMALYGVEPKQFKASIFKSGSIKRRKRMLTEYMQLIDSEGGCAALWDRWCEYVYKRNNERYDSAYEVSALHVKAILGDEYYE